MLCHPHCLKVKTAWQPNIVSARNLQNAMRLAHERREIQCLAKQLVADPLFGEPLFQPLSPTVIWRHPSWIGLKSSASTAENERIPFKPCGEWENHFKPANGEPTNCISIRAEHFHEGDPKKKIDGTSYL